jgi:hypothetical protein
MRNLVFTGLGLGFLLMGGGLFALTLRKASKSTPTNPTKAQLREQAALDVENNKMRIAAGCIGGLGLLMVLFSQL